jgi:acetyl esterase/lipase
MTTSQPVGSHIRPGLSLLGRLAVKTLTHWCWLSGLTRAFILWPWYKGVWPWKRLVNISTLRAKRVFTHEQRKAMAPMSGETIAAWAGRDGVRHTRKAVEVNGFPDIWLHELDMGGATDAVEAGGERGGGKALFYVHGGGYVNTISPVHMPVQRAILDALNGDRGGKVYIPEYSLAPAHPYPAAFVQTVTALATVLEHIDPAQLILAGDSAGGGLLAAALAHLLHPSPLAPSIAISRPLAAAILISPYVTFHRKDASLPASYVDNAHIDFVSRTADLTFQALYGPKEGDVYAESGLADESHWIGLDQIVGKVHITAGEWELIRDDIVAFGQRMRAQNKGVMLEVADKAMHTEVAIDFGTYSEDGKCCD